MTAGGFCRRRPCWVQTAAAPATYPSIFLIIGHTPACLLRAYSLAYLTTLPGVWRLRSCRCEPGIKRKQPASTGTSVTASQKLTLFSHSSGRPSGRYACDRGSRRNGGSRHSVAVTRISSRGSKCTGALLFRFWLCHQSGDAGQFCRKCASFQRCRGARLRPPGRQPQWEQQPDQSSTYRGLCICVERGPGHWR